MSPKARIGGFSLDIPVSGARLFGHPHSKDKGLRKECICLEIMCLEFIRIVCHSHTAPYVSMTQRLDQPFC